MCLYQVILSNEESFGFMCRESALIMVEFWNLAGMETEAKFSSFIDWEEEEV